MKPYAHFDPVVVAWLLALAVAFLFVWVVILAHEISDLAASRKELAEALLSTANTLDDLVDTLYGAGSPRGESGEFVQMSTKIYRIPRRGYRFPSKWMPW